MGGTGTVSARTWRYVADGYDLNAHGDLAMRIREMIYEVGDKAFDEYITPFEN